MLSLDIRCPYCKRDLMDAKKKIDDKPSVRVLIQVGDKTGNLHLSSLYGSYNIWCEFDVPMGSIATFLCPYCMMDLKTGNVCERCHAPMVKFLFYGGGGVQICSRRGCKKHFIEFENIEDEIRAFYDAYPTFFANIHEKTKT